MNKDRKNGFKYLTKKIYNIIGNDFSIRNPSMNDYIGCNIVLSNGRFYYDSEYFIIKISLDVNWQNSLVKFEMLGRV